MCKTNFNQNPNNKWRNNVQIRALIQENLLQIEGIVKNDILVEKVDPKVHK